MMAVMLVDCHAHVLPGVDDGPRSREDSLLMLREAADAGIEVLVCTYHNRAGMFEKSVARARAALDMLRPAAEEMGLRLLLWCEAYLDPTLSDKLVNGKIATAGGAFLLELPYLSGTLPEIVFELRSSGFLPVICHPERYLNGKGDMKILERARASGALVQVNAPSLAGMSGRKIKKAAENIAGAGLMDFLASDAHEPGDGRFDALARMYPKYGPFKVELLPIGI